MSPDQRDERIGEALRRLEVPPHRPEFFDDLVQRLEQEAKLRPQRSSQPSPPRQPRLRRRRRRIVLAAATAAAVAAFVVGGVVLPAPSGPDRSPGPLEPVVANASEVRARVADSLAALTTLQGEVAVECAVPTGYCQPPAGGGRTTLRWNFVLTAHGDERITGIDRRDDLSYRADQGVQRRVVEADGHLMSQELVGLSAGPPDFGSWQSVLRRDVASVVRAFLAEPADVPVEETSYRGRQAWRLVAPVEPNKLAGPGGSGDSLEVFVDRQSGFPLEITETLDGAFLSSVRLSDLVVDAPVDPAIFLLPLPAGGPSFRQDVGFRRVRAEDAAAVVGYQPLLPGELPPGYEMAEVAVASQAPPTGSEAANPPSRDVVSVAYRRGFDRIVVSTRATGGYPRASPDGTGSGPAWDDPLAAGEGFVDRPEPFTVPAGALAGARAELVLSPRGIPHVWTFDDRLVATVAGDATADELRSLVASFARFEG